MFDQSGVENIFVVLCRAISLIIRTREISLHKHNSCVLPRLIKHSLVFIIIFMKCIIICKLLNAISITKVQMMFILHECKCCTRALENKFKDFHMVIPTISHSPDWGAARERPNTLNIFLFLVFCLVNAHIAKYLFCEWIWWRTNWKRGKTLCYSMFSVIWAKRTHMETP